MSTPTDWSDKGIKNWCAEQKKFAEQFAKGDPRYGSAITMLNRIAEIVLTLTRPNQVELQSLEARRRGILNELRERWQKENTGLKPPLVRLNAEAQAEAQREVRPKLYASVDEIADLRKGVEAMQLTGRKRK